ncbi:unnamed protein product [Phytophthora lilii]|uniref:Unnamed protein product n=1 Tax=Phytophthora lilii TaxID=2077276 RepID=A0A9W7CQD5_9STRA|nr:unnamed protein product [Phytophthora lilii]
MQGQPELVDDRGLGVAHEEQVSVAQPELQDAEHVGDDLVILLEHSLHGGRAAAEVDHQLVEEDLGAATRVVVVPVRVLMNLPTAPMSVTSSPKTKPTSTHSSSDLQVLRAP